MKVLIQSKNEIMMKVCVNVKNQSSCKDNYTWNPSTCDCECNKAFKIDEYLYIKNCSCRKRLIGKIVFTCETEILNATEVSLNSLSNSRRHAAIAADVY